MESNGWQKRKTRHTKTKKKKKNMKGKIILKIRTKPNVTDANRMRSQV